MNMDKAFLLVLLSLTASPARAAGSANHGDVPTTLADIAAIKTWAEKSSWGGHSVDVFKSGDEEAVAVQRSFTSGLLTSGLVVFIRIERHWEPGIIFRTVTGYTYKFSQDGDYVHLRSSLSGKELGGFSISVIGQDYAGRTDKVRPDPGRAAQQGVAPDGRSPAAPARR
jgi:hypothetical protein